MRGIRSLLMGSIAVSAVACGGVTLTPPADAGTDSGPTTGMVPATVDFDVLLANNYGTQLHPLFRAGFTSGSALGRMKLFARFCDDPACANPLALVPVEIPGADVNGEYVLSTANGTGTGFAKAVSIASAPVGTSYMQVIGDTELSRVQGLGTCTSTANCPGDFDVVSMQGFQVSVNNDGTVDQPASATIQVTVSGPGASVTLPNTVILGHLNFDRGPLATAAPSDTGTLVAALSNATDTFRNRVGIIDLADASAHPGALGATSYTLQDGASNFAGDICGMVRGGGSLYALTVGSGGAKVFQLDGSTGLQTSTTPVATLAANNPNDSNTYPHACRGVYASLGGREHLYDDLWAGPVL